MVNLILDFQTLILTKIFKYWYPLLATVHHSIIILVFWSVRTEYFLLELKENGYLLFSVNSLILGNFFPPTKILYLCFSFLRLWWSPYTIKKQCCGEIERELLANWLVTSSITQQKNLHHAHFKQNVSKAL